MTEKCFIYELTCKKRKVKDKYLGYTTEWAKCMEYHEEKSSDSKYIDKSTLYFEIYATGGWDNWNAEIIEVVKGRKKALERKAEILQNEEYTLNTQVKSLKPAYIVNPDNTQAMF